MLLPPIGYAETHYSFVPGWSALSRKGPEIVTDMPWRVESGCSLPLLVIVKDAHQYPLDILQIETALFEPSRGCVRKQILENDRIRVEECLWGKTYDLEVEEFRGKSIYVNTRIDIEINGKKQTLLNDNYPTLSHGQLRAHVAEESLPCLPGWHYGDAHVHTAYSSSHVEFGAPVSVTAQMAGAMGLSWMIVADHSYDFMSRPDDYRKIDSGHLQWERQKSEIQAVDKGRPLILGGEEVSCGNRRGQNVHLLVGGNREFLSGSGDGARRKWNKRPEQSIAETVLRARSQGAFCYAAHPCCNLGLLHRLSLNRGNWNGPDFETGIHGLQFWNGEKDRGFWAGRREWIRLLLQGKRLFALAGSDAHGDFNRERKLRVPFMSLAENPLLRFGTPRTCVPLSSFSLSSLKDALHAGGHILTEGPFMHLDLQGGSIHCRALSSREFGPLRELRVMGGESAKERVLFHETWPEDPGNFVYEKSVPIPAGVTYLRGECASRMEGQMLLCLTNPVWP